MIILTMILSGTMFVEWYNGFKQHKAQKAQIKQELMRIVCHPTKI